MMEDTIGRPRTDTSPGPDQPLLSLRVDDVDRATAELESRGVTFVSPATDQPTWGIRVSHFRDPEGSLLEMCGPLKGQAA